MHAFAGADQWRLRTDRQRPPQYPHLGSISFIPHATLTDRDETHLGNSSSCLRAWHQKKKIVHDSQSSRGNVSTGSAQCIVILISSSPVTLSKSSDHITPWTSSRLPCWLHSQFSSESSLDHKLLHCMVRSVNDITHPHLEGEKCEGVVHATLSTAFENARLSSSPVKYKHIYIFILYIYEWREFRLP